MLEVDSPVQQDYDQHDINYLTGFANILAEAVDSSKRTSLLQTTADRMKDMVADRDRLLAAKKLILDEKMLLLDEPFGMLDTLTRYELQAVLLDLWRREKITTMMVTHDVDEAVYLGDRVYIFSPAPGTILHELDVPPPDRPARVMQREPEFMAISRDISNIIEKLETKVSDS